MKNTNDLFSGVRRVLEDQSYYLIAYEPDSETFDPGSRNSTELEVKLLRKGLTVRHRSGFFNVADETVAKKPETETQTPVTLLKRAMMSPFAVNEVSLSLNALFGNSANGAYVRSLLHVQAKDLKFTDEADGSKKAVFDVWAASFGDNGAVVDQITKTVHLGGQTRGI